MQWPEVRRLLSIVFLVPKKVVESILVVIAFCYVVAVFDIYINTERLSRVDSSLDAFCQNIVQNPNFKKGPVVFRVDRGTLAFRLNPYVGPVGLYGYSPFFIFPHHRTIIFSKEALKRDKMSVATMVAHELGHIQGGLKHFGPVKEMELYANEFAVKVANSQP